MTHQQLKPLNRNYPVRLSGEERLFRTENNLCGYCKGRGHTKEACADGFFKSRISIEEQQRRYQANVCLYCADPGHTKFGCPLAAELLGPQPAVPQAVAPDATTISRPTYAPGINRPAFIVANNRLMTAISAHSQPTTPAVAASQPTSPAVAASQPTTPAVAASQPTTPVVAASQLAPSAAATNGPTAPTAPTAPAAPKAAHGSRRGGRNKAQAASATRADSLRQSPNSLPSAKPAAIAAVAATASPDTPTIANVLKPTDAVTEFQATSTDPGRSALQNLRVAVARVQQMARVFMTDSQLETAELALSEGLQSVRNVQLANKRSKNIEQSECEDLIEIGE